MTPPKFQCSPPAESTIDEPHPSAAALTIWQRPFIQNVLPLCTSVALHVAIIVAGIATFHAIKRLNTPEREQVNIPEMAMDDEALPGHPLQAIHGGPSPAQDQILLKELNGMSNIQSKDLGSALSSGPVGEGASAAELSIGFNSSAPGGGRGNALNGSGDGPGGTGGNLMPFGVPGRTFGGGGERGIFRESNRFRKIVYVLDATGSMASSFDALRTQARYAIANLRPPQSFNIIFINDHNLAPFAPSLTFVTAEARQRAMDYIDSTAPRGATDPLPALEKAFSQQPDVIHFLIDPSDFPDKKAVLDLVTSKSTANHVKLNVIGFEGHDAENELFLKSLAEKTGGHYRYVREKDLGNQ